MPAGGDALLLLLLLVVLPAAPDDCTTCSLPSAIKPRRCMSASSCHCSAVSDAARSLLFPLPPLLLL
jgi:hypothetical protein